MGAGSVDVRLLAERLAKAQGVGIQQAAEQVVHTYAERVKAEAQANAPYKTGRLKYSITVIYENATTARITPSAPYAPYQEYGTGSRGEFNGQSYTIRPRKGKYLSFQVNGKWVRTRMVTHPGIPAHPFMRPAVKAALGEFSQELAERGAMLLTKGNK